MHSDTSCFSDIEPRNTNRAFKIVRLVQDIRFPELSSVKRTTPKRARTRKKKDTILDGRPPNANSEGRRTGVVRLRSTLDSKY